MNKFISFYLLLLFVFITRFDSYESQEDESGGGGGGGGGDTTAAAAEAQPTEAPKAEGKSEESPTEKSGETPTEKSAQSSGSEEKGEGPEQPPIGSHDGKCECCAGEGIKCGLRLNWCGAKDCVYNHLYFCDKDNKKAYEYEQCRGLCITEYKEFPDYCAVIIDDHIFYPKLSKFLSIKKDIKNSVSSLNKTFHENFNKWSKQMAHSLDISPEERAAIEKKQIEAERVAREKAAQKVKTVKPKEVVQTTVAPEQNTEPVATQQDTSSEQTA